MASSYILRLGVSRLLAIAPSGENAIMSGGKPALFGGLRGVSSSVPAATATAATPNPEPPKKNPANGLRLLLLGSMGVAGVYAYSLFNSEMPQPAALATGQSSSKRDYASVRKAIEGILDVDGYDDGSYGPLLIRLAWHAAGTYDKVSKTGGSNGATMRFSPECDHGANAGLDKARAVLEPIKAKFPWISYADLWTLAGVVSVEAMGGPVVPWRPGRTDSDAKLGGVACPPNGRLPNASLGAPHIREVFSRMGFSDQEMVALIGAHSLGRCHTDRSGYTNPWTNAPTTFSNLYFQELLDKKWTKKKWNGPLQYEDPSGKLMMLPTDMALIWDKKFKKFVELYAKDDVKFATDFAAAFGRLLELGVGFPAAA